jgi:hypothetical protein
MKLAVWQRAGILLVLTVGLVFSFLSAQAQTASQTPYTGDTQGVACSPNNALSYNGNSFVSCTSGAWAVQPVTIGTQTAACSSTYAGQVQWDGTNLDLCNSSTWLTIATIGNTPSVFSFTNQTGVSTSATISSNAVTLSGFTGTVNATCGTGCTAIARNGTWGSTTVNGFQSGDTIAIRLTSSGSLNTAVTATVTAGTTVSGTWSVTTTSSTPSAFSFTDVTGANTNFTYCSNAATLSGFTGTLTATCNTGCTTIALNGVYGGTTVAGFTSGSTIKICQISSASATTATTASVTVGSTTSSTWTVTTGADACAGFNSVVGTTCPDGTVYAGITPDGNVKSYTTPCDAGQSLVSGSCTGTRLITNNWNNGTTNYFTTGYSSLITGKANTVGLNTIGSTTDSPYQAANYCATLNAFGYTDWYLPANTEGLNTVWANSNYTLIGGISTGTFYMGSSESSNSTYGGFRFFSGGWISQAISKNGTGLFIRCMRHN